MGTNSEYVQVFERNISDKEIIDIYQEPDVKIEVKTEIDEEYNIFQIFGEKRKNNELKQIKTKKLKKEFVVPEEYCDDQPPIKPALETVEIEFCETDNQVIIDIDSSFYVKKNGEHQDGNFSDRNTENLRNFSKKNMTPNWAKGKYNTNQMGRASKGVQIEINEDLNSQFVLKNGQTEIIIQVDSKNFNNRLFEKVTPSYPQEIQKINVSKSQRKEIVEEVLQNKTSTRPISIAIQNFYKTHYQEEFEKHEKNNSWKNCYLTSSKICRWRREYLSDRNKAEKKYTNDEFKNFVSKPNVRIEINEQEKSEIIRKSISLENESKHPRLDTIKWFLQKFHKSHYEDFKKFNSWQKSNLSVRLVSIWVKRYQKKQAKSPDG